MFCPHRFDKSLSEPVLTNMGSVFHQNLVKTFSEAFSANDC